MKKNRPPKKVAPAKPRSSTSGVRARKVKPAHVVSPAHILAAIQALHARFDQLSAIPETTDALLDGATNSLRRLLCELLEQRLEPVILLAAELRRETEQDAADSSGRLREALDRILEQLGAIRFEANAMDPVDPLIHLVVEERRGLDLPDGVIITTVRPGYKTPRGRIAAKSRVVVHRRG
jgi:hypothetical protein